jgi:Tol biopolymer transport system component
VGERDHDAILSFDWNPDSTQVVLVDAFRGASEGRLLIYDVAKRSLTDLKQTASSVAWSPTGSSIVFSSRGLLYMYRPASGDTVQLSRQGIVQPPIAISPDGTSVAFAVSDSSGSLPHLALINLDLRTQYRPIGLGDPADNPAWSFDGTKLAFRRYTPSGRELWVYDLTASGQASYRRLGPLDISGAAWLSDNSTVIASVGQDSTSALYRINVFAGGDPVKITGGPDAPNGSSPSAPPYDRRIGFASRVGDIPQIFVMNGDGSHPQELTDWEADYPYTGWAPNWTSG